MSNNRNIQTLSADCKRCIARYTLNGRLHTIKGEPSNVKDQLLLLLGIYPGLKLTSVKPA